MIVWGMAPGTKWNICKGELQGGLLPLGARGRGVVAVICRMSFESSWCGSTSLSVLRMICWNEDVSTPHRITNSGGRNLIPRNPTTWSNLGTDVSADGHWNGDLQCGHTMLGLGHKKLHEDTSLQSFCLYDSSLVHANKVVGWNWNWSCLEWPTVTTLCSFMHPFRAKSDHVTNIDVIITMIGIRTWSRGARHQSNGATISNYSACRFIIDPDWIDRLTETINFNSAIQDTQKMSLWFQLWFVSINWVLKQWEIYFNSISVAIETKNREEFIDFSWIDSMNP